MSFNSTNPFSWDDKTTKLSDLFTYEQSSYCLYKPFRIGGTFGVKLNERHAFEIGVHEDGVSSKERIRFASYQPAVGVVSPVYILNTTKTVQNNWFLNYKYALFTKPKKTNLYIVPSIGIAIRKGGKSQENVGSFGISGILRDSNLVFEQSNTSYTSYSNRAFLFGLGVYSDLYFKDNYWFSVSLQYSHTNSYLYFTNTRMKIIDQNTNESTEYYYSLYHRASGLYFGISRKIQIIPWKSKSKKNKSS